MHKFRFAFHLVQTHNSLGPAEKENSRKGNANDTTVSRRTRLSQLNSFEAGDMSLFACCVRRVSLELFLPANQRDSLSIPIYVWTSLDCMDILFVRKSLLLERNNSFTKIIIVSSSLFLDTKLLKCNVKRRKFFLHRLSRNILQTNTRKAIC